MKNYFIHNGKETLGPYDLDDLKTKGITKDTPIWYHGLEQWTSAGKVDDLKILLIAPPPFPQPPQTIGKKFGTWAQGVIMWRFILVITALLLVVFLIGNYSNNVGDSGYRNGYRSDGAAPKRAMTVAEIEASKPLNYLATTGTFKAGFWGHKIRILGIVKNSATAASYKDAVVRVISYDKTQTELSREEFTLSDTIKPNSEMRFELKIDKVKDLDTVTWKIVKAKSI